MHITTVGGESLDNVREIIKKNKCFGLSFTIFVKKLKYFNIFFALAIEPNQAMQAIQAKSNNASHTSRHKRKKAKGKRDRKKKKRKRSRRKEKNTPPSSFPSLIFSFDSSFLVLHLFSLCLCFLLCLLVWLALFDLACMACIA